MRRKALKAEQLWDFCSQTAAMTGSGITFPKAISILQTAPGNRRLLEIYRELEVRMEQGVSIGDAMEQLSVFPEMMINMFRAGEMNGKISETAKELASYYKKEYRMDRKIRNAMLYPEILSVMTLTMILVIFLVIVPSVEPVFVGMELPLITRFLLWFSYFLKKKWYFLIAVGCFFLLVCDRGRKNERILLLIGWWKVRMPVIGRQLRIIYTARFARSMSSLYESGLPMIVSIEISGNVIGNRYVQAQFSEVIRRVNAGEMLSHAIRTVDGLDHRLPPTIFVGEEAGKLDQMLDGITSHFEYEAETAVDRMIGLMEPAMILAMGVVIGLILIGIMVPMWRMYGNVM